MKIFISSLLVVLASSQAFASDCSTQAVADAYPLAQQSDFYLIRSLSTTVDTSENYTVVFSCVGETGSHTLSYSVHYADNDQCTSPTITALGEDQ